MRPARFIHAAALGLAFSQGLPVLAQTPPPAPPTAAVAKPGEPRRVLYTATVKDAQADVRSGPSDDPKMYPTNRLRQGDVVEVVGEREDGWLEIKPPQDSFSWINTRFLEKLTDTTWMVRTHDETPIDVMIGSRVTDENQRPTTIGAQLKRGTIVASFWNAKVADDGVWLPIVSPPSEVRYLRAASVVKEGAVPTVAGAPTASGPGTPQHAVGWNGNGNGGPAGPPVATPPPASIPAPPLAPVTHPKWAQAEQLEKEGKTPEAEQIYRQLGNEMCNKNHDLAMRCYNRAEFLRRGTQPSVPIGYEPNRPAVVSNSIPSHEVRLQPVPTTALGAPTNCTPCPAPASMATSVASYFANSAPRTVAAQPSGFGRLRNSGYRVDNRRTFVWEATDGRSLHLYVTEGPGVNLEPYVGRIVEVVGQIVYRAELRANYMVANQVTVQP